MITLIMRRRLNLSSMSLHREKSKSHHQMQIAVVEKSIFNYSQKRLIAYIYSRLSARTQMNEWTMKVLMWNFLRNLNRNIVSKQRENTISFLISMLPMMVCIIPLMMEIRTNWKTMLSILIGASMIWKNGRKNRMMISDSLINFRKMMI